MGDIPSLGAGRKQVLERRVMRCSDNQAGDRVSRSRSLSRRDAAASARSPASLIPVALATAIEAAGLVLREPDDDGERIAIFCTALGGPFIYSREETTRRIALKFPFLAPDVVAAATQFLEDRIGIFLRPVRAHFRQRNSWVHGWRGDY